MDTFLEQIVKVKLDGKAKGMVVGILVVDALLILGLAFLSLFVSPMLLVLVLGTAAFGSYKLISLLSVEFEYIITNGDLDIDRITAKSSRKRMMTIKCAKVEKYGEYKGQTPPGSVKNTYFFCNKDSQNLVYMIAPVKDKGMVMVVTELDERMREAVEKFIPRTAK